VWGGSVEFVNLYLYLFFFLAFHFFLFVVRPSVVVHRILSFYYIFVFFVSLSQLAGLRVCLGRGNFTMSGSHVLSLYIFYEWEFW
jgi:hypothetical protein